MIQLEKRSVHVRRVSLHSALAKHGVWRPGLLLLRGVTIESSRWRLPALLCTDRDTGVVPVLLPVHIAVLEDGEGRLPVLLTRNRAPTATGLLVECLHWAFATTWSMMGCLDHGSCSWMKNFLDVRHYVPGSVIIFFCVVNPPVACALWLTVRSTDAILNIAPDF